MRPITLATTIAPHAVSLVQKSRVQSDSFMAYVSNIEGYRSLQAHCALGQRIEQAARVVSFHIEDSILTQAEQT